MSTIEYLKHREQLDSYLDAMLARGCLPPVAYMKREFVEEHRRRGWADIWRGVPLREAPK